MAALKTFKYVRFYSDFYFVIINSISYLMIVVTNMKIYDFRGGSLVATASIDQSLKIWQIESGFLTQVLVGHEDAVTSCALAEDERLVVSGGKDRKVRDNNFK